MNSICNIHEIFVVRSLFVFLIAMEGQKVAVELVDDTMVRPRESQLPKTLFLPSPTS